MCVVYGIGNTKMYVVCEGKALKCVWFMEEVKMCAVYRRLQL